MEVLATCLRIKQQQEAIDRAVASEKRQRARRKPLGDRAPLAAARTPNDWLLVNHAERAAAEAPLAGETVDEWIARTGQKPEALPADAISGADHSHRGQSAASWNNRPVKAK